MPTTSPKTPPKEPAPAYRLAQSELQDRDLDRLGKIHAGQIADVGALAAHDPRVVPELPRELTIPDVDGVDARGVIALQTIYHQLGAASYIDLPVIPE